MSFKIFTSDETPFVKGYRWIGNSAKKTQEEAITEYSKYFPDKELVTRPFDSPEVGQDDPIYEYVNRWAVYVKVD